MIVEVRTYRMKPGARGAFLTYFQNEVQPRMEAVGMTVVGAFASLTDPDEFAYVRTFASVHEREAQYRAFYRSEDWLGWMIDHAVGHEESFDVFLGDDDPDAAPLAELPSGVHNARIVVSAATGVIASRDEHSITIQSEGTDVATFRYAPTMQVSRTPTGRGMQPALDASIDDLVVGCRVLVLADGASDGDPEALQVVRRD